MKYGNLTNLLRLEMSKLQQQSLRCRPNIQYSVMRMGRSNSYRQSWNRCSINEDMREGQSCMNGLLSVRKGQAPRVRGNRMLAKCPMDVLHYPRSQQKDALMTYFTRTRSGRNTDRMYTNKDVALRVHQQNDDSKEHDQVLLKDCIDIDNTQQQLPGWIEGRVMAAQANFVRVKIDSAEDGYAVGSLPHAGLLCVVRALLKKMKQQVLVGDCVRVVGIDWSDGRGMVDAVLPRNTMLEEPPVANITRILLVFSLAMPPFLPSSATRYLLTAEQAGIPVTVVLNKCDLVTTDDILRERERLKGWGYESVAVSVKNGEGLELLEDMLRNNLIVVAGPSGAGKSSIINALSLRAALGAEELKKTQLDGSAEHEKSDVIAILQKEDGENLQLQLQAVGSVSERAGRGKHTTRNVRVIEMTNGGALVDTPGFNQPSLAFPSSELPQCFPEIHDILKDGSCAFNNCKHISEPGCIVRGNWERYDMYVEIFNELVAVEEIQAKRAMSKRKREGHVRHKKAAGGQLRAEARLDTKAHRRVSRRSLHQEISELVKDPTEEDFL